VEKEDDVKRIGFICIAIVFLLCSVASATNWVFVARESVKNYNLYVDADSVVQDGDTLSCWTLWVFDYTGPDGEKNLLVKMEFKLTRPPQFRGVEVYYFNGEGKMIMGPYYHYDSGFNTIAHKSPGEKTLAAARKYAKNGTIGKGMGSMPTP